MFLFPAVGYHGNGRRKIAADVLHNYISGKTQTLRLYIPKVLSFILLVMKINSTFTNGFSSKDVSDADEDTKEIFIVVPCLLIPSSILFIQLMHKLDCSKNC